MEVRLFLAGPPSAREGALFVSEGGYQTRTMGPLVARRWMVLSAMSRSS